MTRTPPIAAVALLLALAVAAGCKKKSDPPSGGQETAGAASTPAPTMVPATCDAMANHVATVTMKAPADDPARGERLRPPTHGVSRALALQRCNEAQFTEEQIRCVLRGNTPDDFRACNLPPLKLPASAGPRPELQGPAATPAPPAPGSSTEPTPTQPAPE
jgi:hypothetical protein